MNQVRCDSGLLLILLRRLDLHYEVDVKSDAQIMYLAPRLNTQKYKKTTLEACENMTLHDLFVSFLKFIRVKMF